MPRVTDTVATAAARPDRPRLMPPGALKNPDTENYGAGYFRPVLRWLWLCVIAIAFGDAPVAAQSGPPVLLSETDSTRAIALESVVSMREPFALTSHLPWSTDRRTRVMLFVLNLPDSAGSDLASFTADAEDQSRRRYDFRVEHVRPVLGYPWMSGVVLRLSDDVGDVGDVLVRLTYQGSSSNRVRIGIGHVGGGPPDDVGAHPTPAPPYVISGRITSGGTGLGGVALNLSGPQAVLTTTATDGAYSLTVMVPGNYMLMPAKAQYAFDPPVLGLNSLSNHRAGVDFAATRLHTISGQVRDGAGRGIGGVTLTLTDGTGAALRTILTGDDGAFSFTDLPAGRSYKVTPAKTDFVFNPTNLNFDQLAADQQVGFSGTPSLTIRGRVADSANQGIFGIDVTLDGPQTGAVKTDRNGAYSFVVSALGEDYIVTPSLPQDYYSFSPPGRILRNFNSHQIADFLATLTPSVTPSHVLEFDGSPKSVDYGVYFPEQVDLGHFFWEFWAMPAENAGATYLLSDGYGGAHALLFGFSSLGHSEPGRYLLSGNIFDGTESTSFISDEGPAPREWGHFAVGWDGTNIVTYYNGVPVGRKSFAGPRRTPGFNGGGGRLLIGGSDHSNFHGRIAQVRGYEGSNPRAAGNSSPSDPFSPQTIFNVDGSLLSYYFRPSQTVADLSFGHNEQSNPGRLRGTSNGILYECPGCPLPQFVIDPTAPNLSRPDNPGQPLAPVAPPALVPKGALAFDSFSRRNSTFALNGTGGLGAVEGGAEGVQQWLTNRDATAATTAQPFGILNGLVVPLAGKASVAWVPTRSVTGNLDVRVNRQPRKSGSGVNTGISFRVVDANNFFFAYTNDDSEPSGTQKLNVGYQQFGSRTELEVGVRMPLNWTTLRVVTTSGGSIDIYADRRLVYSTTMSLMSTATGAGLYNNSGGMGLTNRWDNFTVYDANQ